MERPKDPRTSYQHLIQAIQNESQKFQKTYLWLERSMPESFFEDVSQEQLMLISHNLMGFDQQDFFSTINLKRSAVVLIVENPDADLKILAQYSMYGIKNYQAYVSNKPLPFPGKEQFLRVGIVYFTEAIEKVDQEKELNPQEIKELRLHVRQRNPEVSDEEFDHLIQGINTRFLKGLTLERIILSLDMFFRAKTRDHCQYEVRYDEGWEHKGKSSMQIVFAWRNTPKHNFLYLLARTIHRHNLVMRRVNATYIDPYSKQNILVMVLGIHGANGKAAWEVANLPDFLSDLVRVKYFAAFDEVDEKLVQPRIISGNFGNLIRTFVPLLHQLLVSIDPFFYTIDNIEKAFTTEPELTQGVTEIFELRFHPDRADEAKFLQKKEKLVTAINRLDTGHEKYDQLRKHVLHLTTEVIQHTLKTNFYQKNLTAVAFRIDPHLLDQLPYSRKERFPELPFGIFYLKGMHFFGFHLRFKDLARGGLRTVSVQHAEHFQQELDHIFSECYNLAYTQHKKNKEIPEGGAKGVLFLKPFDRLDSETKILKRELHLSKLSEEEVDAAIDNFVKEQREEYLHVAQRSYIESLITLTNCEPDGTLVSADMLDYYGKPEYLYIGPDEKMSNAVIDWIADYSKRHHYKPGSAFISSKPKIGINHKEYGATSLGVQVYLEACLRYCDIDPDKETFSIKLSGGPDGDVAGNLLLNLKKHYPKTARVVALTDVSGTVQDLEGLDLEVLERLFYEGKPIRFYPKERLSQGSFLLDRLTKKSQTAYAHKTLCWHKEEKVVEQKWLSGSETNYLFRNNVHQTLADVFVTAGGRPRTLNEKNWRDFLTKEGKPTAKIIVEGANLYLTPMARNHLEELGVLIVKDSSANKTGVICSSFEILSGLTLTDEQFLEHKKTLVAQILERLQVLAEKEADLLLRTFDETLIPMTHISVEVSDRMNAFKYELLSALEEISFPEDEEDPLVQIYLDYALPLLRERYKKELLSEVPEVHKKAVVAAHIASHTLYTKGLSWSPSIIDVLPVIFKEMLFSD